MYHIFTDCDLDGSGSFLVYKWLTKLSPSVTVCRVTDIETAVDTWLSKNKISDYTNIIFLDLDTSQSESLIQKIDKKNVTIYDHHITHVRNIDKYKNAKVYVTEYSSCTRLLYKLRSTLAEGNNLTDAQKLLILMIDDYDSYQFKIPNSYELNCLFWNYTGDRLYKFIDEFDSGFRGFTGKQQNIINFYIKKLTSIKNNLEVYQATLPVKGKQVKFVSTFADSCINDVADHIISEYSGEVGLVINPKTNKISFRKSKSCDVDLSKLSRTMCDEGGGHEYAAGGMICEKFLNITKLFELVSR